MENQKPNFFTQKHTIQSYHTNQFAKASLCSLFQIMLEAAWAHAQVMDWGYDQLHSKNMFWVLSRMYLEIEKYPSWQDTITLNTWSAGTDGMYAYREYLIENDKNEVLLRCSSAWLILDMENRKIVLLKDFRETFPRAHRESVCREPKRIRPNKHSVEMDFSPVMFSDLDLNKHFNSVKSLERILDHFGVDFLNETEPAAIEVNYLKEGLAGDQLAVVTGEIDSETTQSTIVRESDLADLSTVRITWRPRQYRSS